MTATGPIKNPAAYGDPFATDTDLYTRPRQSVMHGDIPMDVPRPRPGPKIELVMACDGSMATPGVARALEIATELGRSSKGFRDRRPLWMQQAGIQFKD